MLFASTMSFIVLYVFFFKQKTAYEMRISDWSSDVCSSDLVRSPKAQGQCMRMMKAGSVPGGSSLHFRIFSLMRISFCTLAAPPRPRLTKRMTQAAPPLSIPNFRVYLIVRLSAVLSHYAMMMMLVWHAYNITPKNISLSAHAAHLAPLCLPQLLP